ncbi:MAG: competence protein ComEC, partial [Pseudomonadota bacterium]
MTLVILSFASGVLFLQLQPALPGVAWVWSVPFCLFGATANRKLAIPMAAAIGFCWALGMAHLKLADRLAPELEGKDIEVVGVVASLPAAGER